MRQRQIYLRGAALCLSLLLSAALLLNTILSCCFTWKHPGELAPLFPNWGVPGMAYGLPLVICLVLAFSLRRRSVAKQDKPPAGVRRVLCQGSCRKYGPSPEGEPNSSEPNDSPSQSSEE